MRILNGNVTSEILAAAVSLLRRSVPELTPHSLAEALRSYNPDACDAADGKTKTEQRKIESLYTVSEVAEILRLSKMSVLRLCYSGKLEGRKVGGKVWRFSRKALEDFISVPDNAGKASEE